MQLPGDVIFTGAKSAKAVGSTLAQRFVDESAGWLSRGYEHVAIVLSHYVALEAVPVGKVLDAEEADGHRGMYERGAWTGALLRGGVRFIPVADLIMPADSFTVFRPPPDSTQIGQAITPYSPAVYGLLGSAYSIDQIKDGLRDRLGPLASAGDFLRWGSPPEDYLSKLGIDGQLSESLRRFLPDFPLPELARTYYCSQLVDDLLTHAGQALERAAGLTTPTGLAVRLRNAGWEDVSEVYRAEMGEGHFAGGSPLSYESNYLSALVVAELGVQQLAADLTVNVQAELLEKFTKDLRDLNDRLGPKPVPKPSPDPDAISDPEPSVPPEPKADPDARSKPSSEEEPKPNDPEN